MCACAARRTDPGQQAGERPKFQIRNISADSLGVGWHRPRNRLERMTVLIPRNTALPVAAKWVFRTRLPGQKSAPVETVEGESLSPMVAR